MLEKLKDGGWEDRPVFGNEATLRACGKTNKHNIRIWGTDNLHVTLEYVRDSPKVNVFCVKSKKCVY